MDLQKITSAFISELTDSFVGKQTSLRFLKTNISSTQFFDDKIFQVMVLGEVSLFMQKFRKMAKNSTFLRLNHYQFPTFSLKNEDIFLSFIQEKVDNSIKYISLNFAFPLESTIRNGVLDGKLLSATKMHSLKGLVGKNVGQEVESYIKKKTGVDVVVSVANDTICLLLAGTSQFNKDSLGCLIVGTGYNSAFFLNDTTIVNLEAAGFDKFEHTNSGEWVNKNSLNISRSSFEKEVSGAYLYKHYNFLIKDENINTTEISSTKALSEIAKSETLEGKLARKLLARSASLVATHLAGIAEFKKKDMVFVVEGSLFWKGYGYREIVEETVSQLTTHTIKMVELENSSILGGAMLFGLS